MKSYPRRTPEQRFWDHVTPLEADVCWPWTPIPPRYGALQVEGRARASHRFAYELLVGPIPKGMFVCHTCDYPPCCNPAHLFVGTPRQNMQDRDRKGRGILPVFPAGAVVLNRQKTHCPHGHPYEGDNVYFTTKGARMCRECHQKADRERYWRMKAKRDETPIASLRAELSHERQKTLAEWLSDGIADYERRNPGWRE